MRNRTTNFLLSKFQLKDSGLRKKSSPRSAEVMIDQNKKENPTRDQSTLGLAVVMLTKERS